MPDDFTCILDFTYIHDYFTVCENEATLKTVGSMNKMNPQITININTTIS